MLDEIESKTVHKDEEDDDDDVEVPHSARASRSVVLQHNHLVVR